MTNKTIVLKLFCVSFLLILLHCTPAFCDIITEINYDDGIGIDLNSYIELNDHIRPVPSNASLSELYFSSSDPSIASINILADGTIKVTGHKIGYVYIQISNQYFTDAISIYVVYPRSGSELDFDTSIWWPSSIRNSRNCYAYAFNLKDYDSRIDYDQDSYSFDPGQIANIIEYNNDYLRVIYDDFYANPLAYLDNIRDDIRAMLNYPPSKEVFKCLDLNDNITDEFKSRMGLEDPDNFEVACSPGTYKVAFFVDDDGHMHWYRQDSNGLWSDKDGIGYITNRDLDNKYNFDPRICASKYKYIGCFEAEAWQ